MNEVLKMKGCVCMTVKEIKKQMKMFFLSTNFPHQTDGNDSRWKQQRRLVKRDPLITLACSSKGRWLL